MTYEEVITMIRKLGDDAMYTLHKDNYIKVTLNDESYFDDDWEENAKYFYDPAAVEDFLDTLTRKSLQVDNEYWYSIYYFEDFTVEVKFLSSEF